MPPYRMMPALKKDGYKADHRRQYPEGTELIVSNFTPRADKHTNLHEPVERLLGIEGGVQNEGIVFFGLQYFIMDELISAWRVDFFDQPRDAVVREYERVLSRYLGTDFDASHIGALHDLHYLPLRIRALPEGTLVPYGVPALTIENTLADFYWLPNFFETILSNKLWKACTSATTARFYRRQFEVAAEFTGASKDLIGVQGHDFSFRGMSGLEDACLSGAGHLTSFIGTDTIPAIPWIEHFYAGVGVDDGPIGVSIPATEHSVMCAGGMETEEDTFDRLIFDVYPEGLVSVVSDTWDFWKIITEYLPSRKDRILARDGKVVIRPDSGDPVKIICGDPDAPAGSPQALGAIRCLYETFGGSVNEKGFHTLAPQIGLIYGDSITPDRCTMILSRLAAQGLTTDNVVLGIGSFTYEMVTRDTHGFAMKATYGAFNGEGRHLYKDPKTDDGVKKSLRGLFSVRRNLDGDLCVTDGQDCTTGCLMETVFENGALIRFQTFEDIRERVAASL